MDAEGKESDFKRMPVKKKESGCRRERENEFNDAGRRRMRGDEQTKIRKIERMKCEISGGWIEK